MSAERVLTPQPTCEACWLKDHARWEPESVDDEGNVKLRLIGVDVPNKYNTQTVEICSQCGKITVSGIFELRDPELDMFTNHKITSGSPSTFSELELWEREEEEG